MKKLAIVFLLVFSVAGVASAGPIIGYSTATFSNLSSDHISGTYQGYLGSNTGIWWGCDSYNGSGNCNGGDSSTLNATTPFNFNSATDVTGLKLAELAWFNAATSAQYTEDDITARWNLAVTFTSPAGGDSDVISFAIENTPNPLGDFITLDDLSGLVFNLPGVTVSNLRYVREGSGSLNGLTWSNPEDHTSTLYVVADFSAPASVPEPGSTMFLLASSLVGLVGAGRRWMTK
jgi:hypothetical protein